MIWDSVYRTMLGHSGPHPGLAEDRTEPARAPAEPGAPTDEPDATGTVPVTPIPSRPERERS